VFEISKEVVFLVPNYNKASRNQLKRNMSQIMLKFLKEVIPFVINNYEEGFVCRNQS
jgi:enterochelin esterase-like enzyme